MFYTLEPDAPSAYEETGFEVDVSDAYKILVLRVPRSMARKIDTVVTPTDLMVQTCNQ